MPGSHRLKGVFIAAGPDVKHTDTQYNLDIKDLSAFVLWAHECNANWKIESVLPPFCEREIQKTLTNDYEKPQSKIGTNMQNDEKQKIKVGQYSEQEKKIIYKRLASLGYLE